jgi:diaminohydroxyphosphoribosylaminopyrimidine deaminase / 5-amino-6-(5-phosphoribosylamino)uracil reductase
MQHVLCCHALPRVHALKKIFEIKYLQGFNMNELSQYMAYALELAARGRQTVSPNPMVGCVIVNQQKMVGEGYHRRAGDAHAELYALEQAGVHAKNATAYVTLEPCCHHGKTPPCTDALIKAGIKKVYAACLDPNPLVAGKGILALQNAGIEVEVGLHEREAIALNEIFFHYMRTKKPFVIGKWAMSLDGKTITHPEDSRDISNTISRKHSHQTRQQVDAILIGANTAVNDNPQLNVRFANDLTKQPLRIVLSTKANLPLNLKLFTESPENTLLVTTHKADATILQQLRAQQVNILIVAEKENRIDLQALLIELGKRNITSLLVEGGMTVLHDFFAQHLVNQIQVYLAPNIIAAMPQKQQLANMKVQTLEQDLFISIATTGEEYV